ncbi:hypothetical protein JW823_10395 [bacterium]|nr:hypothetical protein [candidate division CSSED10-310 bacterium]
MTITQIISGNKDSSWKTRLFLLIIMVLAIGPQITHSSDTVMAVDTAKTIAPALPDHPKIIPFQLQNDRIILQAVIGDSKPMKLILDTGMQSDGILVYNPDIRDSITMIDPIGADISGAGKDGPAGAVFSDSMGFRIAGIEFPNHRIIMLQNDSFRGFPSDGVVGYSLLGHYAVEVNYDRNELLLHDSDKLTVDASWTAIPLFFKENKVPWTTIRIAVEDESPVLLACYIDSASRETIECLTRPGCSFKLPKNLEPVYLGRGLSGDINGNKGKIGKVMIGPHELHDIEAAFVPTEHRSKQPGADGVIGGGLLKHFNVIYDYTHLVFYLKPRETDL